MRLYRSLLLAAACLFALSYAIQARAQACPDAEICATDERGIAAKD